MTKLKHTDLPKEITVTIDPSNYARVFDELNVNWESRPEYNLLFLKSMQNRMNDLLHTRGHVFLNDVYDYLGFQRTSAGAVVGWLAQGKGAKYIDFGIRDFQTETSPSVILDFNVDGVIYDKI